jgi:hypothetical protein
MKTESKAKLKKLQTEARNRIANRGKLEFRADQELIKSVLAIAAKQKQPVGPMIRQWIKERMDAELAGRQTVSERLDKIEEGLERLHAALANSSRPKTNANQRIAKRVK